MTFARRRTSSRTHNVNSTTLSEPRQTVDRGRQGTIELFALGGIFTQYKYNKHLRIYT